MQPPDLFPTRSLKLNKNRVSGYKHGFSEKALLLDVGSFFFVLMI